MKLFKNQILMVVVSSAMILNSGISFAMYPGATMDQFKNPGTEEGSGMKPDEAAAESEGGTSSELIHLDLGTGVPQINIEGDNNTIIIGGGGDAAQGQGNASADAPSNDSSAEAAPADEAPTEARGSSEEPTAGATEVPQIVNDAVSQVESHFEVNAGDASVETNESGDMKITFESGDIESMEIDSTGKVTDVTFTEGAVVSVPVGKVEDGKFVETPGARQTVVAGKGFGFTGGSFTQGAKMPSGGDKTSAGKGDLVFQNMKVTGDTLAKNPDNAGNLGAMSQENNNYLNDAGANATSGNTYLVQADVVNKGGQDRSLLSVVDHSGAGSTAIADATPRTTPDSSGGETPAEHNGVFGGNAPTESGQVASGQERGGDSTPASGQTASIAPITNMIKGVVTAIVKAVVGTVGTMVAAVQNAFSGKPETAVASAPKTESSKPAISVTPDTFISLAPDASMMGPIPESGTMDTMMSLDLNMGQSGEGTMDLGFGNPNLSGGPEVQHPSLIVEGPIMPSYSGELSNVTPTDLMNANALDLELETLANTR